MITVAVVIHNIPGRTELLAMTDTCLRTLQENTPEPHDLLLIDNGSQDKGQTLELLRKYSDLVIRHDKNECIARCWNTAIDNATEEVVLVNNDAIFHKPGWLCEIISPLVHHSYIGATGSRKLDWNGFIFLEGSFLAFLKPTALLVAEDGKVFDENFKFSCEDTDFCQRLLRLGKWLETVPIEEMGYVTHLRHGTLCWNNEEGGWGGSGESIVDIMRDSQVRLCEKYGRPDCVN